MRIVVIGGVAAGMSAASQARRRLPSAEVVVFERGPYVSYGACGMPYNLVDPDRRMDDLVVIPPERFREERGIDVRTGVEVLSIDAEARRLVVRDGDGREREEPFDRLVVATGARALVPPIPGIDLPGVFKLRELTDGERVRAHLTHARPHRATLVGAGYIGMEMAEALVARGLKVNLVEKMDQVIPGFEREIAEIVEKELLENGVTVETGVSVEAIECRQDGALAVTSAGATRSADLVLLSVGVRPNVELAAAAGIALGETGAIRVDPHLETSVPGVFAAGDCAEDWHRVARRPAWVPLGTTANKQGRVAGANAAGARETFAGIVGTAGFRVFGLEVARTGLTPAECERLGIDAEVTLSRHKSRGHGFPGGSTLTTALVSERGTGRLLGAQMVGREGVALRIDVLATALTAEMTVDQVAELDLAYAPPFAPVYDPILIAARSAAKEARKPRASGSAVSAARALL